MLPAHYDREAKGRAKRRKRPDDARCETCVHAAPFVVTPGIGSQDGETTRRCTKWGFAVGVEYMCPKWKAA